MAEKILKYYKNLFTYNNNQQIAQLFFASHSEEVISDALQDLNDTIVIVLKNINGQISAGSISVPSVLPYTLAAEVNFQAFDVATTDYHNALYGYIEAEGWKILAGGGPGLSSGRPGIHSRALRGRIDRSGQLHTKRPAAVCHWQQSRRCDRRCSDLWTSGHACLHIRRGTDENVYLSGAA